MKIDLAPNILLISFQKNMKQLLIAIAAVELMGFERVECFCKPTLATINAECNLMIYE